MGAWGLAALLGAAAAAQPVLDPSKYPDWKGQWLRTGRGNGNAWDPTKPIGLGVQAPLAPKYQAIYEAALKDEASGGQGIASTPLFLPSRTPTRLAPAPALEAIIPPD